MSKNNVEIVAALYEAFTRRDIPAILQAIDPEITITQTEQLPWGGSFRGIEGLQTFFGKLFENVESQVTPEEIIDAGEKVVVFGKTRGRAKKSGKEFDVRAVHVWTLRDGKGLKFEPNVDTPKMLEALAA